MLRHVVLLTLVEGAGDTERSAITDALAALPSQIATVRRYVIGTDLGLVTGNADIGVVADFDDATGWAAYRDHPAHQRLLNDVILPVLADRTAIQFEL